MITIVNPNNGKTAIAAVKDKCMGCEDYHIDLTSVLFNDITDGDCDGTCDGFKWYFNDNAAALTSSTIEKRGDGKCEDANNPCSGAVYHFDGPVTSTTCGGTIDPSDMAVAIPPSVMADKDYQCGRTIAIENSNAGLLVEAVVKDTCHGCVGDSIEVTTAVFNELGFGADGAVGQVGWWFIN